MEVPSNECKTSPQKYKGFKQVVLSFEVGHVYTLNFLTLADSGGRCHYQISFPHDLLFAGCSPSVYCALRILQAEI
jgi:hypothetical protein